MSSETRALRRSEGYPHPTSAATSAVMKANRKRDTGPEMSIRRLLHARGLRYRVHHRLTAGLVTVRPDIVFLRRRVAVFIDGCFWHSCPQHGTRPKANTSYWEPKLARNRARDVLVNDALAAAGWRVLRIWEHELPIDAADRVIAAIADSNA
jgi:DNA mismatch endonuclease, patch repair protein